MKKTNPKSKPSNVKSKKTPAPKTQKKGSLKDAVYQLFDSKGITKVTYQEVENLAKKIKPDTKFNKYHFSWYRNNYKKTRAK